MKAGRIDKPLVTALALGLVIGIAMEANNRIGNLTVGRPVLYFLTAVDTLFWLVPSVMICVLARRCYFWWGFVPPLVGWLIAFLVVPFVDPFITWLGPPFSIDWTPGYILMGLLGVVVIAIYVIVTSGPISLVRYALERRRKRVQPVPLEVTAGKEGAWPPPPVVK